MGRAYQSVQEECAWLKLFRFFIFLSRRDMQRYHTLLAGASWMAEYGNPDTDDWHFLKQYSPYHSK